MSNVGNQEDPEEIELPHDASLAFAALMDVLVAEEDTPTAGEGGEGTPAPSAPDGQPTAPPDGTGREATAAGVPTAGAGGGDSVPTGGAAPGHELPEGWTASASELSSKIADLAPKITEATEKGFLNEALEDVRGEYGKYFEALEQHPRTLVGTEVPSLKGEGMEVLRDSEDAKDWQEAVKQQLLAEVRTRASRSMEANSANNSRIADAISLFTQNKDLVPYSKEFDLELANRFTRLAKPYETRDDKGKLLGYTVPVQGLIDQVRAELKERRQAPPAASAATAAPAAKPAKTFDPPQAGVQSRANNSGEAPEDFSTLFGTLGLPNLRF